MHGACLLMENSVKVEDELLVVIRKNCAMVKVNGRGSFKAGPSMKRFGALAIEKGCTRIFFDMENCQAMDSTFMGVLAGLALRIQREAHGQLVAMNLSPKTASLLAALGLNRLVECYQSGALPAIFRACLVDALDLSGLDLSDAGSRVSLETMLEAHQTLVEIAPENLSRFRDVITYLDQDLKDLEG